MNQDKHVEETTPARDRELRASQIRLDRLNEGRIDRVRQILRHQPGDALEHQQILRTIHTESQDMKLQGVHRDFYLRRYTQIARQVCREKQKREARDAALGF